MTPKEKALELVDRMYFSRRYREGEDYIPEQAWIHAKECALIAVDEITDALEKNGSWNAQYWEEVKQEIEKI